MFKEHIFDIANRIVDLIESLDNETIQHFNKIVSEFKDISLERVEFCVSSIINYIKTEDLVNNEGEYDMKKIYSIREEIISNLITLENLQILTGAFINQLVVSENMSSVDVLNIVTKLKTLPILQEKIRFELAKKTLFKSLNN